MALELRRGGHVPQLYVPLDRTYALQIIILVLRDNEGYKSILCLSFSGLASDDSRPDCGLLGRGLTYGGHRPKVFVGRDKS